MKSKSLVELKSYVELLEKCCEDANLRLMVSTYNVDAMEEELRKLNEALEACTDEDEASGIKECIKDIKELLKDEKEDVPIGTVYVELIERELREAMKEISLKEAVENSTPVGEEAVEREIEDNLARIRERADKVHNENIEELRRDEERRAQIMEAFWEELAAREGINLEDGEFIGEEDSENDFGEELDEDDSDDEELDTDDEDDDEESDSEEEDN